MQKLGDRIKQYENVERKYLTRRVPVIIRVDGRAFHSFTKREHFKKPYDLDLMCMMNDAATSLFHEVQGAKMAYVQSDEISLLVTDYDTIQTEAWFAYNLNKVVSISAARVTASFAFSMLDQGYGVGFPCFDSRAFNLPLVEVPNYFIWRQRDWVRNSLQMLARSLYSHKQLQGKNNQELFKLCSQKGHYWEDLPSHQKYGRIIVGGSLQQDTPVFNYESDIFKELNIGI